jgi:hypothetical protein
LVVTATRREPLSAQRIASAVLPTFKKIMGRHVQASGASGHAAPLSPCSSLNSISHDRWPTADEPITSGTKSEIPDGALGLDALKRGVFTHFYGNTLQSVYILPRSLNFDARLTLLRGLRVFKSNP